MRAFDSWLLLGLRVCVHCFTCLEHFGRDIRTRSCARQVGVSACARPPARTRTQCTRTHARACGRYYITLYYDICYYSLLDYTRLFYARPRSCRSRSGPHSVCRRLGPERLVGPAPPRLP